MKVFITRTKQISTDEISFLDDKNYPSYVNKIDRWWDYTEDGKTTTHDNQIYELFDQEEMEYFKYLAEDSECRNGIFVGSGASEWAGATTRLAHVGRDYTVKIGFKGLINIMAGKLANELGFNDYIASDATACISSLKAMEDAVLHIKSGRLDRALVIGWDDQINTATLDTFGFTGASLTKKAYEGGKLPSAFDETNGGFFIGNGVGYILLENKKAKKESGNKSKAEIISTWVGAEVNKNPLALTENGYFDCMENCLNESGLEANDILFVKAHGSGTGVNNKAEYNAFLKIFEFSDTVITSYKPEIGHTMGASGVVEMVIALDDIKDHKIRAIKNNNSNNKKIVSKNITVTNPKNKYIMFNGSGMGNVFASVIIKNKQG